MIFKLGLSENYGVKSKSSLADYNGCLEVIVDYQGNCKKSRSSPSNEMEPEDERVLS